MLNDNYVEIIDKLLNHFCPIKTSLNAYELEIKSMSTMNIVETFHVAGIKPFSTDPIEQTLAHRLSTDNSFGVICRDLSIFDFCADMGYPIMSALKALIRPDAGKGLTKFAVYQKDIPYHIRRNIYEKLYNVAGKELIIIEIY